MKKFHKGYVLKSEEYFNFTLLPFLELDTKIIFMLFLKEALDIISFMTHF